MSHFTSCTNDPMGGSHTLWTNDFGVNFSLYEKHGRDAIWVYFMSLDGAGGDGMNVIGSKLDKNDIDWLAKQIGYTATTQDQVAINAAIADIKKGISPAKHLKNIRKSDHVRGWESDPSP